MPETRQILAGSTRGAQPGARLIGRTDGASKVDVTVILNRKTLIPQDDILRHALSRPHERLSLSHADFAEQFGASDEAVQAVSAHATQYGLTVTNIDTARRIVQLSGSASNMELAFGTVLHDYAIGEHTYRGRQGPLLLPTEWRTHVEAVLGLDSRPVAKPRIRPRTAQPGYYPQQIAAFYKYPEGDGTGQTVALIELGGNYGSQDLQAYLSAAGLGRTPTVRTVSVSPGVPVAYGQDPQSDGEVMLDIEVVGAMAPGATIVVYFADNTDQGFYQAVSQAVHDPATTAISISWGSPEKDWSEQSMDAWNTLGQSATLLNVPIFVAAGDHGCTDEQTNDAGYDAHRHADFPGTCANGVVSCGGTSLRTADGAIVGETVWNDGDGWATGGGVSTHFQIPSWQSGITAEGGTTLLMRGVPDVAGVADPNTGIYVRANGSDGTSGGTSAVAPQWAALTAILSQALGRKAGFFIPLLYSNKDGATNDILSGNNTVFGVEGFLAKSGWDACTGIGSPSGKNLLSLLSGVSATAGGSAPGVSAPVTLPPPADNGVTSTVSPQPHSASPFDPKAAVLYGQFVQAAYSMHDADPQNLTPSPSADFPPGYQLAAWVQMRDFIVVGTGPLFYGFIAQSTANANQFVLAIRGTSNGVEWWDDANAVLRTPFKVAGCGSVGMGFARIYDTLEVVERPTGAAGAAITVQSLRSVGGFSRQVSSLVQRHAVAGARAAGVPSGASLDITGHSLGSALATLYAMENAHTDQIDNPLLCTFASPLVGDSTFVAAFNALDLTSWRIVNAPDIVPNLPPEILGFRHVDACQQFDSRGKVKSSLVCWHSMATYLSLIDTTLRPDPGCQLASTPAQSLSVAPPAGTTVSAADRPVTVNITVNVGPSR